MALTFSIPPLKYIGKWTEKNIWSFRLLSQARITAWVFFVWCHPISRLGLPLGTATEIVKQRAVKLGTFGKHCSSESLHSCLAQDILKPQLPRCEHRLYYAHNRLYCTLFKYDQRRARWTFYYGDHLYLLWSIKALWNNFTFWLTLHPNHTGKRLSTKTRNILYLG